MGAITSLNTHEAVALCDRAHEAGQMWLLKSILYVGFVLEYLHLYRG